MRALFIGGTGFISTAVTRQALAGGIELYLLHRHADQGELPGAHHLVADVHDREAVRTVLAARQFDVVVDWVAFAQDDVERQWRVYSARAAMPGRGETPHIAPEEKAEEKPVAVVDGGAE